jgi:hypothetical protein
MRLLVANGLADFKITKIIQPLVDLSLVQVNHLDPEFRNMRNGKKIRLRVEEGREECFIPRHFRQPVSIC